MCVYMCWVEFWVDGCVSFTSFLVYRSVLYLYYLMTSMRKLLGKVSYRSTLLGLHKLNYNHQVIMILLKHANIILMILC